MTRPTCCGPADLLGAHAHVVSTSHMSSAAAMAPIGTSSGTGMGLMGLCLAAAVGATGRERDPP